MPEKTIQEEAAALRTMKEQYNESKAETEALKAQFDAAQSKLIERMEDEKVEGVKVDGTNFVPAKTTYGKITDRRKFIEWAKIEAPELLEDRERKELLNELARQRIDDGEEMPPGMGSYDREYISQRAA